jgi:hypothetical protein
MTRLSCGVPVVISRWKQRNARQLPSVLWIFATCALGVAWKRGGPLQTKRAELLRLSPGRSAWLPLGRACLSAWIEHRSGEQRSP